MIAGLDSYWRLHRPWSLTEHLHKQVELKTGRRFPDNTSRLHLGKILGRSERQALDYHQCTYNELHKFALERGLAEEKDAKRTIEQLVELLETADEDRTFHLMDLSPELRCQSTAGSKNRGECTSCDGIITDASSSFAALQQPVKAPVLPPLARTCKLCSSNTSCRRHSYQTVQFHFTMGGRPVFSYDEDTHRFLARIHYKNCKTINKFSLDVEGRRFEMTLKTKEKGSEYAVFRKGNGLMAHDYIAIRIERCLLRVAREHAHGGKFSKFDMLMLPENIKKAALQETMA
ncbi:hypothetical protein M409DRAFT_59058 [Zasmidium cellare ATCC 36951]|uniref:Uncharacterized protein n=1 Tax=Zasmidium cellare ATCC 36951 TaxID=1080233 RepID=A0A6A6C7G8_ZASCE|nr:uncharacterized protein M409DRAFT_59058 [Zasmidium cellare ATCC 36951]KAF2161679.1 hypothetical protein M409DRAFT_59058 [Zasmidium cellare ATCC 36951]